MTRHETPFVIDRHGMERRALRAALERSLGVAAPPRGLTANNSPQRRPRGEDDGTATRASLTANNSPQR
jgi:hypothetical protein